ncbi:hypothetical protein LUX39_17265 [Actinomadura madurae]|nr:hypothetical protein [Actinomadura madurae]MCP9979084.1 hypothetical protein [Actinomadura madurae]MCQ0009393.1 hypothetical protein [Actinomadura madurae]MCQ0015264.1 hypothetical protein [Actinomadura madurae]
MASPVWSEIHGMSGSRAATARAASRSGSAAPSISGEWKACETARRRTVTPFARRSPVSRPISSSGPDRTRWPGALTAATATAGLAAAADSIAAASPAQAIIAPEPGSSSMRRPRVAARVSASSRVSAPATHAAANAPTLWPSTPAGRTPIDSHSRASATSTATRAGWQYRVAFSRAGSSSVKTRSRSEPPISGRSTSSARSMTSANTGLDS